MHYVTGKAAATSRRITWIAAVVLSGLFGLLSVPFLFSGFHLGEIYMIAAGLACLAVSVLTWLLPFPEGRAGVPLLTLGVEGIAIYPAAQWSRLGSRRPVRVDLGWSQVERIILRKPPRGRPSIAFAPTDAAARSLNLRPPTWQNKLLARWTRPMVVVLTDGFDCASDALLAEIAKAAQAAGRQAKVSPGWDGGATVILGDGQDRPGPVA